MFSNQPLAERMRPVSLDDYVGQEHLAGRESTFRKNIESGNVPSFILWGPPGVGKTTLAQVISTTLERPFYRLSAVHSGVKEVRETIEKARKQQFFNSPNPILFIDEIHRFSKSQQDSLLGAVEQGVITLIGATTENPSFEIISPLLSRCQVYILKPIEITDEMVMHHVQQNLALYDKGGERHYDIISAFIKSVRGSDPNGAVYWLARMVEGGEDPKFIARRLIILAAEDIGLANPNALLLAKSCFDAVNMTGWPESRIILSETAIYLALCPKSNSAYLAIDKAIAMVKETGDLPVPLHLRNAPTRLMKDIGYGKNYKYAHSYPGSFAREQFLPEKLEGNLFYLPGDNSRERETALKLAAMWKGIYPYKTDKKGEPTDKNGETDKD
ncbi:MAG: replication-associated recombination protein A [Bacteroidales bacterium]|nr:replication-associated recombination protein A [Bacteroidales bacterium]